MGLKMQRGIGVTKEKCGFGQHLTLDLSDCPMQPLVDHDALYDILNKLPDIIGMTKITLPHVVKWLDEGARIPGYSGFVMIAESHISLHTFPERNYVFLDLFSCRPFEIEKAAKYIVDFFKPGRVDKNVVVRGRHFQRNGSSLY